MSGINIIDNSGKAKDELERAVERGLIKMGIAAEGHAKLACRVDTGRLRGSIVYATHTAHSEGTPWKDGTPSPEKDHELHGTPPQKELIIGTNVEYAAKVEFDVKPFLRPAAENHRAEYKRLMESELMGQ